MNSGAAHQAFEWMARTRLAPFISSEIGGSAVVFDDPADVAAAVDLVAIADAAELAAAVTNALADAAEEALWRDQALAVVLP